MDEMDVVITATRDQLVEFLESFIWKDMIRELELWKASAAKDYDQVSDLLTLGKIQGRREAIDYILGLPKNLLEVLEDRSRESTEPFVHNLNEEEEQDGTGRTVEGDVGELRGDFED